MPEDTQDTIVSQRQSLTYEAKDLDLISAIDKAIQESNEIKAEMDSQGAINKAYWKNGSAKDEKIHPKRSRAKVNRIFTDTETLIPLITSEIPEGVVVGTDDNNIKYSVQKALKIVYESKYKMKHKFQTLARHWILFKVGIMKYRWDKDKKFVTENVLPRKVGFDKRATSFENCEYIWEEMEDTVEGLMDKFKNKKKELETRFGKDNLKSKVKYIEFWGGNGEWLVWKLQEIVLEKIKNPNFDYENPENNLFVKPQFPYLILSVFNNGDNTSLYDETSLIEECIPTQDGVNQLERQILDLNEGRKRVWAFDSTAVNKNVQQQLVDETGDLAVSYDGKFNPNAVAQVQAGIPDASMQNNLLHLLAEIDNIFGTHPTTKGEQAGSETARGRQLLMTGDVGRLDPIVSNLEDVCEEWYNAYLHMHKVYADNSETITDGKETFILDFSQIPGGIRIMVQKGTTLPTDEKTKHDQAVALSQAGLMSPKSLYEEIGYPNPDAYYKELVDWLTLTGKIAPPQVMPQGEQLPQEEGQPAQEGQQDQGAQQLQKVQAILQSPQFQQLTDQEQQQYLQEAKQIVATINQ